MEKLFTKEDFETFIRHYQQDLEEMYQFLMLLENEEFLKESKAKMEDLPDFKKQLKFVSFYIVTFLDILVAMKILLESNLAWERKYHIKNALVSIYEAIKTFNSHQKEIRHLVQSKYPSLEPSYTAIGIQLREYKKRHNFDKDIVDFRNKAGAHYDEDFIEYIHHLNLIDKPQYELAIKEFGDINFEILKFWMTIADAMKVTVDNSDNKE